MKRYEWLGLLIVFVGLVSVGAWYYYRDYPVFTDVQKVDDYPSLPWQAVVDGSVSRSLARQAGQGKLRDFGPEVAPVTRFVRLPGEYVENNGVDLVELPSEIVHSPQYLDTAKRPFVIVAYFQTMIEGEKHYLIYQRWRSVDGSESYVPLEYGQSFMNLFTIAFDVSSDFPVNLGNSMTLPFEMGKPRNRRPHVFLNHSAPRKSAGDIGCEVETLLAG